MYKRIIIKISGEMLGNEHSSFNDTAIEKLACQIKTIVDSNTEVSFVVGGGNFWRGRSAPSGMNNVVADQIGMIATVMNGLYFSDVLQRIGVSSVVMTPFDVNSFTEKFSLRTANKYLKEKTVIIFAGGSGHPFFSTDIVLALRAQELKVDAVLFAKNIDGVYNSDPNKDKAAKKYKVVDYNTVISKGLEFADIPAICILNNSRNSIPSVVFEANASDGLIIASKGEAGIFNIGGTKVDKNVKEEFYEQ
jgi:uridylate kinase